MTMTGATIQELQMRDYPTFSTVVELKALDPSTELLASSKRAAQWSPGDGVLQPWTKELTMNMQGSLLGAIRGADGVQKEDLSKTIVRGFRSCVMHDSTRLGNSYMTTTISAGELYRFFKQPDQYPMHWLMHLIHASEVLAAMHPDHLVKLFWTSFYYTACDMLHMNPETIEQFETRLADACERSTCYKG